MRVCEAQFLSKAQPVSTVSPHCAITRTCRWQNAQLLCYRQGPGPVLKRRGLQAWNHVM